MKRVSQSSPVSLSMPQASLSKPRAVDVEEIDRDIASGPGCDGNE